jgi:hypothetical protein
MDYVTDRLVAEEALDPNGVQEFRGPEVAALRGADVPEFEG